MVEMFKCVFILGEVVVFLERIGVFIEVKIVWYMKSMV